MQCIVDLLKELDHVIVHPLKIKLLNLQIRTDIKYSIEPESNETNEIYVGGMSRSMPYDIQERMIRTLPGLEHAKIVRNAYAIEYDAIDAIQLCHHLNSRDIKGLFSGGQFNGSSVMKKLHAQGLIAGINAARKLRKRSSCT